MKTIATIKYSTYLFIASLGLAFQAHCSLADSNGIVSKNGIAESTSNQKCIKQAAYDDLAAELAANPPDQLPSAFDWRAMVPNFPPVRNQRLTAKGKKTNCGSCWAFAATGVVESALAIFSAETPLTQLSEQQLLSCVASSNCDGGSICQTYNYIGEYGETLLQNLAYTGKKDKCRKNLVPAAYVERWAFIGSDRKKPPTDDQLKEAIINYGPITVTVWDGSSFSNYKGGVFGESDLAVCVAPKDRRTGLQKTNHFVVIVGWGTTASGKLYWVIKNSYGPTWGENGYMRILAGCSAVGQSASYVVTKRAR